MWTFWGTQPRRGTNFYLLQNVHIFSGGLPALLFGGYWKPFTRETWRPRRKAGLSSESGVEAKNEWSCTSTLTIFHGMYARTF